MIALSPAQLFELARIADRHGPLNLEHRPDRRVAVTIAEHPLLVELAIDVGGDTGWLGLMAARTLPAGGGGPRGR
jgi:hypothetical protein